MVGWGLALIIILGGVSQLKDWRMAPEFCVGFRCPFMVAQSWSELASDAVGQLGFAGKLFGEGLRISMLGSAVPLANGISSWPLTEDCTRSLPWWSQYLELPLLCCWLRLMVGGEFTHCCLCRSYCEQWPFQPWLSQEGGS